MSSSRSPALGFIFVTIVLDCIGLGVIIPVMPKLIMQLGHMQNSEASLMGGFLLFAYAATQFLCAPIMGALSDQYGRRVVLLASLFGFALDYVLLAFSTTIAWLFVGRIVAGAMGSSVTTAGAYIGDISTPEKKSQNFGIIGAAFGLGFVIGPALGGLLGMYGERIPFLFAAVLSLLNWLYGYFILPESLKVENRRRFSWKRANPVASLLNLKKYPLIKGLVASLMLLYIASHAIHSIWSFYTTEKFHWNSAMIGWSLTEVGILVAIVQGGLIRFIIPKFGQHKSLYLGLSLNIVGFVSFAFASEGWMMFAFLIPYCLGSISGPALQGMMSSQVHPNEQGELQGALTALMSITSFLGPLIMTQLFRYFTQPMALVYFPGAPMIMAGVLTLISLWLASRVLNRSVDTTTTFHSK